MLYIPSLDTQEWATISYEEIQRVTLTSVEKIPGFRVQDGSSTSPTQWVERATMEVKQLLYQTR